MARKLRLIFSLLLLLTLEGSVEAVDYTQDANCQLAYLFTESSGTTVDDASQNSQTGSFASLGHPAWSSTVPAAFASYSADFDGTSSDYINAGDITSIDGATAFTVVHWVYFNTAAVNKGLVSKWGSIASKSTFLCFTSPTASDEIRFITIDNAAANYQDKVTNDANLTTTTWYHIAYTFTATTNTKIYVGGSAKGLTTIANDAVSTLRNGTANFDIGTEQDEPTRTSPDGLITEIALFTRELSSTEINDIMDNGLKGSTATVATGFMTTNRGFWGA